MKFEIFATRVLMNGLEDDQDYLCVAPRCSVQQKGQAADPDSLRPLATAFYGMMAAVAVFAFVAEVFSGFGLLFNPGWANGWGDGFTISRVWSAVMTSMLLIMMVTLGIGGCGVIGVAMGLSPRNLRTERSVGVWLLFWVAVTALTCVIVYRELYALALAEWPNGYFP